MAETITTVQVVMIEITVKEIGMETVEGMTTTKVSQTLK
jgi:hypothetical protein